MYTGLAGSTAAHLPPAPPVASPIVSDRVRRAADAPCEWGYAALHATAAESSGDDAAAPACLSAGAAKCQVGLTSDLTVVESRFNLHSLMNYGDVCSYRFNIDRSPAAQAWWAAFKSIPSAQAQIQLNAANAAMKDVFFDTLPAARPSKWLQYALPLREDMNTLLAVSEAVLARMRWSDPAQCEAMDHRNTITYRDVANGLREAAAHGGAFATSDSGYLLGLVLVLRAHATEIDAWMTHHVDPSPESARRFVEQHVTSARNVTSGGQDLAGVHAYAAQRSRDLAALLLYIGRIGSSCMLEPHAGPTLTAVRAHFSTALADEPIEEKVLARMFLPGDDPDKVFHDGNVFRNAAGLDARGLQAAWANTGDIEFNQLSPERQLALVRQRMLQLEEHPDYRVGDVEQAMANSLMRMEAGPNGASYVRYHDRFALLDAWQARHRKWIENRDFVLSPELYASILGVEAHGIQKTGLSWYQDVWEKTIMAPILGHRALRSADVTARTGFYQWLARTTQHWDGTLRRWRAVTTEQYADGVMAVADVLYRLRKSEYFPYPDARRMQTPGGMPDKGVMVFPDFLDGLSTNMKNALYEIARDMDVSQFMHERILSENWLFSALRIMNYGHQQAVVAFQSKPTFSVEVEAYLALIDAGVSQEDIGKPGAYIVSASHPLDFRPPVGVIYNKFLEVIRSPRRDDFMVLPGGKRVYPHHIINRAFDIYIKAIPTHPWVVATAKANLRQRGVPLMPSELAQEIERLVEPLKRTASKSTLLGTKLGDLWFGQLPITSPILKLSRALRDGKFGDVPYYALLLMRDALGMLALSKAMAASYLPTMAAGGRLLLSGLQSSSQVLRLPSGRAMRDWGLETVVKARVTSTAMETLAAQMPDYKKRVTGPRNQGKAARHFSGLDVFRRDQGAGVWGTDRLTHKDWENLRNLLSPTDVASIQMPHVARERDEGSFSVAHLAAQNKIEDMGSRTGVFGLADINGDTWVEGRPLAKRVTVALGYEWILKAIDRKPRDVTDLLERHVTVRHINAQAQGLAPAVADERTVRDLIARLYVASPLFRGLINWYDSHALERYGLDIVLDGECDYPFADRPSGGFRTELHVPSSSARLPIVLNEEGFAPLSFDAALLEGLMMAIMTPAALNDPSSERGVSILFTNRILLQSGDAFTTRINADYFESNIGPATLAMLMSHTQATVPRIRAACEAEDQYLERLDMFNELSLAHAQYQGKPIADRPTVFGVIRSLARIQYREALERPAERPALFEAQAAFDRRFDQWFAIERKPNDTQVYGAIREFFWECYGKSVLFRLLVDQAGAVPEQPWRMQLDDFDAAGVDPAQPLADPIPPLFDPGGVIHVRWNGVQYLGLLRQQTWPVANGTSADDVLSEEVMSAAESDEADWDEPTLAVANGHPRAPAFTALSDMEPYRRILDGVIAVFTRDALQGTPALVYTERGVAVWITDMILWDVDMAVNKRLVRALDDGSDPSTRARLDFEAPGARRAARIEDDYIARWVARLIPGED